MFNYFFYYHIYEKETNLNFVHFANTKPTLSLTSRQNITSHAYTTRFRTLQLTNNTFSIPQKFKHFLLPLFETMLIKLNSLNINGFNKSADKLAQFINQHNIHITFIQETHTIQQQQLSHFAHQYNFLVYPNTDHSLTLCGRKANISRLSKKSQAGRKANITCLFLLQVSTAIVRQPLFAIVYVTCYNSIVRHALCAIIVLAPFYGCLGSNLLQCSISTCLLRHLRDTEKAVVLYRFYFAML